MLSASTSIIIGVVSGILTSLVIWITLQLFKKVVLPWYQELTYQGLNISGGWIGIYSHTENPSTIDDPDYIVDITQQGHAVSGTFILRKQPTGDRSSKEFIFNGTFRDGNLVFTYKPKDNTRLGLGSYVLVLTNDGQKLEGSTLYVSSDNKTLYQFKISWIRKVN